MDKPIRFFEKATMIDADPYLTQDQKDVRLAQLMTAMEQRYKIPMLRDDGWEKENSSVILIYREISNMRKI